MIEYYQVTLSYACFGIEVEDGIVIKAAPIGKWMVGKDFISVINRITKMDGKMRKLEE